MTEAHETEVEVFVHSDSELAPKPYHYRECGLENVFLLNGYSIRERDGKEYVSVNNVDELWKAICMNLVTAQKAFSPGEVRFLRKRMGKTQLELSNDLRVDEQTVARWEKGKAEISGPADLYLRVLMLSADVMQPEGKRILARWKDAVKDIIEQDTPVSDAIGFAPTETGWEPQPMRAYC